MRRCARISARGRWRVWIAFPGIRSWRGMWLCTSGSRCAAGGRCCEDNMPTDRPKVSALVVAYNHSRYIAEALDSIYAQTYGDYEVIVVDDGSSDGTPDLMKRWPRVRYHYQQNQGPNAALNRALELA